MERYFGILIFQILGKRWISESVQLFVNTGSSCQSLPTLTYNQCRTYNAVILERWILKFSETSLQENEVKLIAKVSFRCV
jgi:hypothetical protein